AASRIFPLDRGGPEAANSCCMKLKSYLPLAFAGAVCMAVGNFACAADNAPRQASTKSASSGKTALPEIVTPTKDDVVIFVKVTGSLIPQRYVIRNGQILNASSNTTMLLVSGAASSYNTVAGMLYQTVPDIQLRRTHLFAPHKHTPF